MSVSLCMIAKNEGKTIGRALRSSLPFVDEYVIGIDDTTTDDTYREVVQFAERVEPPVHYFMFKWESDFSKARNDAMAWATKDFIFTLDGHEEVISGHEKLKKYAADPQGFEVFIVEIDMVSGKYETSFFQERLFLNDDRYRYHNASHNVLIYESEKAARLIDVKIEHKRDVGLTAERMKQRTGMNIRDLVQRIVNGDRRAKAQLVSEYMAHQKWESAIIAIDDYLKDDMEDAERYQILIKLGMCYFWTNDLEKSEKALWQSSAFNADRRNAHFVFLGELYQRAGNIKAAGNMYIQAVNVPKPEKYWFLYPKYYHEIPKQKLKKLYDNHKLESHHKAAN